MEHSSGFAADRGLDSLGATLAFAWGLRAAAELLVHAFGSRAAVVRFMFYTIQMSDASLAHATVGDTEVPLKYPWPAATVHRAHAPAPTKVQRVRLATKELIPPGGARCSS